MLFGSVTSSLSSLFHIDFPCAWLCPHVWHQSSWNVQPPVLTPDRERGVRVGYTKQKKGIKEVLREKMRSGHYRDCPNTELKRWGSRPLALRLTRLWALRAISEHVTTNKEPILHSWEAFTGRNVQLYLDFLFRKMWPSLEWYVQSCLDASIFSQNILSISNNIQNKWT